MFVQRVYDRMRRGSREAFVPALLNIRYAHKRVVPIAIVAIVGFPLYYYVWSALFPQPYENLPLRLIGSAIFVPLLFHERWPDSAKRYFPHYWYAANLYALPFFFTFMLLKNGGVEVWGESALIAAFAMVLLLDWLMLLLSFTIGVGLAVTAYWLTTADGHLGTPFFAHLWIISFAVVIGAIANYHSARRTEQERAVLDTAASVAHELRTPLLAIRAGAAGLSRFLPLLLAGYEAARQAAPDIPRIRLAHLSSMRGVLERIDQEVLLSNSMIDMLLVNARGVGAHVRQAQRCSIADCVRTALARYPFRAREHDRIRCELEDDFEFEGSETLFVHVLFNLIKNALNSQRLVDGASISIRLSRTATENRLRFRDNGTGIDPEVLPHIFTRFYTRASLDDVSAGAGIGLAFCRDVMHAIGGAIDCSSRKNEYTEFVLRFPTL